MTRRDRNVSENNSHIKQPRARANRGAAAHDKRTATADYDTEEAGDHEYHHDDHTAAGHHDLEHDHNSAARNDDPDRGAAAGDDHTTAAAEYDDAEH
ncbi:MAG: hypothetical protein DMF91_24255, partial [Acidobacteria bacterium]